MQSKTKKKAKGQKINLDRQIDVPTSGLLTYDKFEINYDFFGIFMLFKKTKEKKGMFPVELVLTAIKIKIG